MALKIKDEATDKLARRLAAETGESITVAVRVAMEERLERIERRARIETSRPRLERYIERAGARVIRTRDPLTTSWVTTSMACRDGRGHFCVDGHPPGGAGCGARTVVDGQRH